MPHKWVNTITFGSGHTLGTLNHGSGSLLCCFITLFGAGGILDPPGTPLVPPGAPLNPLVPQWPLVCHPGQYSVTLGHYESYLTHLEWIIQAFTLQYPHTPPPQTQYNPKKVTKINFFWNFLYDPPSNTPYETIGTEKNCLIKCFGVLGFAR